MGEGAKSGMCMGMAAVVVAGAVTMPLCWGCASQRDHGAHGPGVPAGMGHIDAEMIARARAESGASEGELGGIKIRTDDAGGIRKLAIYHREQGAVPDWLLDRVEQEWPGAQVRAFETEWYAEVGRVYEVEVVTAEGRACEWSVGAGGIARYSECELAVSELPAAVRARVESELPGGTIEEAELRRADRAPAEDGSVSMEVRRNGREYYLRVRADGSLAELLVRVPAIVEIPLD